MAKATFEEPKPVPPPPIKVILELDLEEAIVIAAVLGSVGSTTQESGTVGLQCQNVYTALTCRNYYMYEMTDDLYSRIHQQPGITTTMNFGNMPVKDMNF